MNLPFPLTLASVFLLLPLTVSAQQASRHGAATGNSAHRTTALPLPFFDDFAGPGSQPDTLLWEPTGATKNNTFSNHPPTQGVVTLNGITADGVLYDGVVSGTSSLFGYDTLTSRPIDLSGRSNVRISFWWQRGGIGDVNLAPTTRSTLYLEFSAGNGNWDPAVWEKQGTGFDSVFARAEVVIPAPYLTNNFQFRFRTRGRFGDAPTSWNLDYIEIDPDRMPGPVRDVALVRRIPSFLQPYTALPVWQYNAAATPPVSDSSWTSLSNLELNRGSLPTPVSVRGEVRVDLLDGPQLTQNTFLTVPLVVPADSFDLPVQGPLRIALPAQPVPLTLHYKGVTQTFIVTSNDPMPAQLHNDTLRRTDVLADYYAYDDGSAETTFNLFDDDPGSGAWAFDAQVPDQVAGVSVYFGYYDRARPTTGRSLTVNVWADDPQQPGQPAATPLASLSFTVPQDSVLRRLGRWFHIWFPRPQAVSGRFYVGYSQPANSPFMTIGRDLNDEGRATGRGFARRNVAGNSIWRPIQLPGAVMVRPRMNNNGAVGLPENAAIAALSVFPNPVSAADGTVRLQGHFQEATLLDALGRPVRTLSANATSFEVHDLTPGLYALRFRTNQGGATRRLVITR